MRNSILIRLFTVLSVFAVVMTSLHLMLQMIETGLFSRVDVTKNLLRYKYLMENETFAAAYYGSLDQSKLRRQSGHSSFPRMPPPLPLLRNLSSKVEAFLEEPVINPHPYGYLHNPEMMCGEKHVDILFVIPSAPENVWKRRKVRKSGLGLYSRLKSFKSVSVVFFLGLPDAHKKQANLTQTIVCAEAEKYGDIVQENFTDVYRNIRLKAVSMLRWAATYCSNASYVIRMDDDVAITVNVILSSIKIVGSRYDNFVLGDVKKDWGPSRYAKNKYYVTKAEFANDTYPPFALGGLLGYPLKTVRLLFEASLRVKPLWLDDVYITGLCAPEIDAVLVSDMGFRFRHLKEDVNGLI
ncbi:beta-1,3-galactosyltransferase 1-like [Aplysia californica]|uniref:Hexosyltransferase n=1 Tax=Aplysia californica TaxID=6500 RepID=A0ABM0JXA0_APLCA|nr:beta-1,3-galactosyltransferase 1-like [Aplysia californica]